MVWPKSIILCLHNISSITLECKYDNIETNEHRTQVIVFFSLSLSRSPRNHANFSSAFFDSAAYLLSSFSVVCSVHLVKYSAILAAGDLWFIQQCLSTWMEDESLAHWKYLSSSPFTKYILLDKFSYLSHLLLRRSHFSWTVPTKQNLYI